MKKIMFMIILLILPVNSYANDNANTLIKALIQSQGYTCDTVSSVQRMVMSKGYSVYCNNYKYAYDVKDIGGKYKVYVQ